MWEIFEKLLKEKGLTAYKISKETGIGRSTFTDWKNGRSIPGTDKLIKIAECLDVSVEYLKTGKETSNKEKAQIDVQLSRQPQTIKEYMLKFANLPEEKRNQIMSLIDMLEGK